MQIDEATTFEITLLARAFKIVLMLRDPRPPYWIPLCEMLFRYQAGAGLSTGFFTGRTNAERMSLSRLLKGLQDDNRIALSGKARALSARLTLEREAEVLGMVGMPAIWETREAMTALSRIKGDGFHLLADHKDSQRDKAEGRNQVAWTYFRVITGVLHGRIDWKPSMQTGYVFASLTDKGREELAAPMAETEFPADDLAGEIFDNAMQDAGREFSALVNKSSQEIGIICAPHSFGELPRKTLCRMIPDRSIPLLD
ncbi:hypothetical protein [Pontiella sulfatireligans]|uniref:Uncharacterized protein n=1 Tax=Pontiella sulfatireligans TaxID=2750658 RepID=A0A6C2USS3_9BACT|nr:hypothetical protein [Pontiella sulfatireligans]VGO23189.1 hypothetical protein SCARR_05294 [Pontiella sulfatireligans]